jgi:hypothetical protein
MRRLVLATALVALCGTAQAREPLARPMERTPSIMVEDREAAPRKAMRPRAAPAKRKTIARARSVTLPRPSAVYEADTRAINRSISESQQRLQIEQRQQVDTNLFRQEIQRSTGSAVSTPSVGCTPGSLGC